MNRLLVAVAVAIAGAYTSACTTVVRAPAVYAPPSAVASDEVDLVPPVPTFVSVQDCELAYRPGACGTGAVVYERANIAVPVGAEGWFVPFAFGAMTGVLLNDYFAPPGVYVADFEYRSFTSTTVIEHYRTVNRTTINNFHQALPNARAQAQRSGPVRYSPSRGSVTGPARFAGTVPSHNQTSYHPGTPGTPVQPANPGAHLGASNTLAPRPTPAPPNGSPNYSQQRVRTPAVTPPAMTRTVANGTPNGITGRVPNATRPVANRVAPAQRTAQNSRPQPSAPKACKGKTCG